MSERWFVYILECDDGSFYTGISRNPEARYRDHRLQKGALFTKGRKPVRLVWTEIHISCESARNRESQIKRWTRRKKWAVINGDYELLKKL